MALRCLLFSSDEGTAEPIRQVLAGLSVEGEYCTEAVTAVERVTNQNFQIVIIDWDKQPEAGLLLTAARERKAAERPLTLAIVSDDASVPQALQAGANSILRKPLQANQIKDTLATARDLLRAKQGSAAAAQSAAAGASAGPTITPPAATPPAMVIQGKDKLLRAGEFLQSLPPAPGAQFVVESDPLESLTSLPQASIDLLQDLEPVAAPVVNKPATPAPAFVPEPDSPPQPDKARGLEWYLKTRAGTLPPIPSNEQAAPALSSPSIPSKPELIDFGQSPLPSSSSWTPSQPKPDDLVAGVAPEPTPTPEGLEERKQAAELFAYMEGEADAPEQKVPQLPSRLGKRAIIGALLVAGLATAAAPQAPWHSNLRAVWARGQQAMHSWLNPQTATPVQAPVTHEDFGRAGDEYKLPVSESIPDATTDPSQIQVVPVVDPTAKKTNNEGTNAEPPAIPTDGSGTTPSDQTRTPGVPIPENAQGKQPSAPGPETPPANPASASVPPGSAVAMPAPATVPPALPPAAALPGPPASTQVQLQPVRPPHDAASTANVPSSLKSQVASMTPDASGNKAPETAMDSIEPVAVTELAERALLTEQPPLAYPASARGQQGTVTLQVLIGRDGTVQDAKFLQGSLAFARAAIDGVKQWKFKPYLMNGRAVSVQSQVTMNFKPGQ